MSDINSDAPPLIPSMADNGDALSHKEGNKSNNGNDGNNGKSEASLGKEKVGDAALAAPNLGRDHLHDLYKLQNLNIFEDDTIFSGRIVHLIVGEAQVKFTIHEKVLLKAGRNTFFSRAFSNSFKEAADGCLPLPEDDPALIGSVVKWFYAVQIGVANPGDLHKGKGLAYLVKLYTVAEKYLIYDLQDSIISQVYFLLRFDPKILTTVAFNEEAFEEFAFNLPEGSLMYQLILRAMAFSVYQLSIGLRHLYSSSGWGKKEGDKDEPLHTSSEVDRLLETLPDEIHCAMFKEVLRATTFDRCRGFEQVVGSLETYCISKA